MIGSVLGGKYEILEEVGSDGIFFGFKAREKSSGKYFFIRTLVEGGGSQEFQFAINQVVESVQDVSHPNVERFKEFCTDDGGFLVSEWTAGTPLDVKLKRLSSLSVPLTVALGIELSEGLDALHSNRNIHGGICPAAVLSTAGEGAKLLLPGFWAAYSRSNKAALTMVKKMSPFMAPEVTAGGMPTVQSDIYSLGCLLWQVLAGRPMYPGDQPAVIAKKHASDPYPSLRSISGSIPLVLDEIIKKCTSKEPVKRYATVSQLLNDLRTVQDALRFGKKLTWPLAGGSAVDNEPLPVAPTLNAIDAEPQEEPKVPPKGKPEKAKKAKKERDTDGVPPWLVGTTYTVTVLFCLLVFAWAFQNSRKPRTLQVPNIVGMQVDEARAELQKMKLKLREARRVVSEKHPEGAVMSSSPSAGSDIRENTFVEVEVSKGSKFVEVPDFRGRTLEETKKLAQSMNLEIVDAEIEYVRDRELDEGLVVSQIPEARKKVERHTRIRIKVSNGNKNPQSGGRSGAWHTNRIQFVVPENLTESVVVRIDVTDDNGTKLLFEEVRAPGEAVDERVRWQGTELIIRIFFDGELIEQKSAKPDEPEGE
ncbi:PASTA domain-containing protein [Kamptonema cortianum]|nr:PASTA domain-containing protein [Geitlerinema splendidum]MDK3162296.1 PASTA domain-containing protein [Kamptonema cortianum]